MLWPFAKAIFKNAARAARPVISQNPVVAVLGAAVVVMAPWAAWSVGRAAGQELVFTSPHAVEPFLVALFVLATGGGAAFAATVPDLGQIDPFLRVVPLDRRKLAAAAVGVPIGVLGVAAVALLMSLLVPLLSRTAGGAAAAAVLTSWLAWAAAFGATAARTVRIRHLAAKRFTTGSVAAVGLCLVGLREPDPLSALASVVAEGSDLVLLGTAGILAFVCQGGAMIASFSLSGAARRRGPRRSQRMTGSALRVHALVGVLSLTRRPDLRAHVWTVLPVASATVVAVRLGTAANTGDAAELGMAIVVLGAVTIPLAVFSVDSTAMWFWQTMPRSGHSRFAGRWIALLVVGSGFLVGASLPFALLAGGVGLLAEPLRFALVLLGPAAVAGRVRPLGSDDAVSQASSYAACGVLCGLGIYAVTRAIDLGLVAELGRESTQVLALGSGLTVLSCLAALGIDARSQKQMRSR
ncbi:MAG: hypothetical protein AAF548_00040 [Actinomycetota bacterium]